MEVVEPTEASVATAVTESTVAAEPKMAIAVKMIADHALESAPSESVAAVEVEMYRLPTHRTMLTEVAHRGSIQVVYPATRLRIELVYSAA